MKRFLSIINVVLFVSATRLAAGDLTIAAHADASTALPARARGQVTPKLLRYAERVVRQYDADENGYLDSGEWKSLRGAPELADLNHDGQISMAEFAQFVADYSVGREIRLSVPGIGPVAQSEPVSGRAAEQGNAQSGTERAAADATDPRRNRKYFAALPAGVPAWFIDRDSDGDSQLTLTEFSPKLLRTEIAEFNRLDVNQDGVLTPQEFLRGDKSAKPSDATAPQANP